MYKQRTRVARVVASTLALVWACSSGGGSSDSGGGGGDAGGDDDAADVLTTWMFNTTDETSAHIEDPSGAAVLVNVQSAESVTEDGVEYALVRATGIPDYEHTMTEAEIEGLNDRPNAETDFVTGETTATAGERVLFGQDIGYDSRSPDGACAPGDGFGYWPPGPACPAAQEVEAYFPVTPEPGSGQCETGLGPIGLWRNGVALFNWDDGLSYELEGAWENLAFEFERFDADVCSGHAAGTTYHHHFYPACLAEELGDDGTDGHSPPYGFAADGYAVYGPWEDGGVLARSCWRERNYDDPESETGCGEARKRTCYLVDVTDVGLGTVAAPFDGPDTDQWVETLSGNEITAVSGVYVEDFYFDPSCTEQGSQYLDEFNGHSDDERGFHYHVTLTEGEGGTLEGDFPFTIGPTYYGRLYDNAIARCDGDGQ